MCCSLGNGSYEVYDNAGNLLCSGGAFGSSETNDIGCPTSLPIELLSFTGKAEDDRNFIEWDVLTEINCDYYIVEHSTNFVSWTEVGEVDGVGTTSNEQHYFLYDNRPVNSINYYRLKQVDMNGEFKFYGPIVVNRTSDNSDRVLINKTNLLGQKVSDDFEGQIILFYSDGTKEISLNQ